MLKKYYIVLFCFVQINITFAVDSINSTKSINYYPQMITFNNTNYSIMHFIYQETHNINVDQLLNILKKNQKIDKVLIFIKVNPNLNNQQEVQFFNTVEYIFNVFQNHLIGSEISIQSYSSDFVNQYSFGIYIK